MFNGCATPRAARAPGLVLYMLARPMGQGLVIYGARGMPRYVLKCKLVSHRCSRGYKAHNYKQFDGHVAMRGGRAHQRATHQPKGHQMRRGGRENTLHTHTHTYSHSRPTNHSTIMRANKWTSRHNNDMGEDCASMGQCE